MTLFPADLKEKARPFPTSPPSLNPIDRPWAGYGDKNHLTNCWECLVPQSCLTLCDPMDCSPPGSSVLGFSRQEYWSGLLFPLPGDFPKPGIEPTSPALQMDSSTTEPLGNPQGDIFFNENFSGKFSSKSTK